MKKKEKDLILIPESLKPIVLSFSGRGVILFSQKTEIKFSISQICNKLKLNQPLIIGYHPVLENKRILFFERVSTQIIDIFSGNNFTINE